MSTLGAARSALSTYLTEVAGLHCYGTVPGAIVTPAAIIAPNPAELADYEQAQSSDLVLWYLRVVLLAGMVNLETAQNTMDDLLSTDSATSVPAAIRADPTLGGQVEYTELKTAQRYGSTTWNGIDYLGAELTVEISC